MDAQYVSMLTGEAGQSLFGARTSSASKTYGFYYHTEAKTYRMFYNADYSVLKADAPGDRITIVMDKNTLYFGDSLSVTRSYEEFACSYTMYLFAVNEKDLMKTPSASRLYSCQIYDNGTLVRDYVPCKNSSGVAGLYDLVNGVFYTNAGTGSFAAGYISIDFSTLQGLTIPEGVVTQIADASGRVLWSAVKKLTVTIDDWSNDSYWFMSVSVFDTETGKFVYNDWETTGATVQVSSGYISVKISSDNRHTEDTRASIYVNGVEVKGDKLREGDSIVYAHTLTKNTIVKCVYEDASYEYPCPRIYITET